MNKCFCQECGWQGTFGDVLEAPNPFEATETITGCSDCKAVDGTIRTACYETGCWREATCGTNHPDGYRCSCFKHSGLAPSPSDAGID